ncbi:MAG: metallophosphoesterase [Pirellulales bacterium]
MLLSNLLYNALLAVVVAAVLFHLRNNRTALWFVALGVPLAAAAIVAAAVVGMGIERSNFASMRLLCFGVFVHAPIYAAIGCLLLRRTSRGGAVLAALAAVAIVAIGIDAFFVEPQWLEVTHYEIRSDKVAKPLRIVVLADIQTDDVGEYERDVLRRVVEADADLILFAGDYLQVKSTAEWKEQREKLRTLLREAKLATPLGAFAVEGNVDYREWPRIFDETGVVATVETGTVELAAGSIRLTCLSEPASGAADGADRLESPGGAFRICMGHRPDFALGEPQADLLIAGHTHGGQVQLPVVGPLVTLSRVRRSWASGLTEIRSGQHLFVSRGIGMERSDAPRLRFLCRPELAIIEVVPR